MTSEKRGVGTLFGLPFALVGLITAYYQFSMLYEWHGQQSWLEVPAYIKSAELDVRTEQDETTYIILVEYSYKYKGWTYESSQVGRIFANFNRGAWAKEKVQELQGHIGGTFRCFVNPKTREAVLYRDIRLPDLALTAYLSAAFFSLGFMVLVGVFPNVPRSRADTSRAARYPNEPWRWRQDWDEGVIRAGERGFALVLLVIGAFCTAVSIPFFAFLRAELLMYSNYWALLLLILPAAGVTLVLYGGLKFARWLRFGGPVFELHENPGVVGGNIEGALLVPRGLSSVKSLDCSLKCVESVTTGSGKYRNTVVSTLWAFPFTIGTSECERFGHDGGRISIKVPIPHGLPDSDATYTADHRHQWVLEIRAELPGRNFEATYEVPVYTTEATRTSLRTLESVGIHPESPLNEAPKALDPKTVIVRELANGTLEFSYGIFHDLYFKFFLLYVGLIFSGVAAFFYVIGPNATTPFLAIFGFAGVVAIFIGLWNLLLCTKVVVRPGSMRIVRSILFLSWAREIPEASIDSIEARVSMYIGGSPHFALHLLLHNGKTIKVGSGFRNKGLAQLAIQLMIEAMAQTC